MARLSFQKRVIPIDEKRIDWNAIRAEYIGGSSYGTLAKRHGLVKSTIFKKSKKEGWDSLRKRTANEVETKTIQRTAEVAADNATRAQAIKGNLLERLQRIAEKYPYDATEVRQRHENNTVIFRIRDLTAAYKDLTEDLPKGDTDKNTPIMELLKRLDGECDV